MSIPNELIPVSASSAASSPRAVQFRSVVPNRAIALRVPDESASGRPRTVGDAAPLRICHVMSGDQWAGAEMQLLMMATCLAEQPGVTVSVVLFNEGRLARELRQIGVPVTILDEARSGWLALLRTFTELLREQRIHVLHTHKYKDGVLGAIAAKRARVPHLVRTMHGLAEPELGWDRIKSHVYHAVDRMVLRRSADLIIAVSQRMAEGLRDSGFRPTMVTCIHNGVDVRQIRAARTREEVRRELQI